MVTSTKMIIKIVGGRFMENIELYNQKVEAICDEINKVIFGKNEVIRTVLMGIIAGGHILIDDIPGVGKTTMAAAFARAMGLEQKRMQFTPDVLPSDVTGFSLYNKTTEKFEYRIGAVMCNLFLADEINRTSPKTQSALLEVMEEGRVTVDGVTREVPKPFVVIATQNPTGSIGTQKLPESQLDRFMIKVGMGYPSPEDEVKVIQGKRYNVVDLIKEVITKEELITMQKMVDRVYIEKSVCMYIAKIAEMSRTESSVQLGVSPRGSIAIARMAKAYAFVNGRDYVIASDVKKVLPETAEHRIVLNANAKVNKVTEAQVIQKIADTVVVPTFK